MESPLLPDSIQPRAVPGFLKCSPKHLTQAPAPLLVWSFLTACCWDAPQFPMEYGCSTAGVPGRGGVAEEWLEGSDNKMKSILRIEKL